MRNTSLLRRAAALGCAALLTFGLAACGGGGEPPTKPGSTGTAPIRRSLTQPVRTAIPPYAVVEIASDKVSVTEFDGKNASGALRRPDTELAELHEGGGLRST